MSAAWKQTTIIHTTPQNRAAMSMVPYERMQWCHMTDLYLDHTDLTIAHADELVVDKTVVELVARLSLAST